MDDGDDEGEVVAAVAPADADREDAAARALADALAGETETPTCAICPASADFYLYEADRVSKFVCWEHVSPVAAAVDEMPADADRPVAVRLD